MSNLLAQGSPSNIVIDLDYDLASSNNNNSSGSLNISSNNSSSSSSKHNSNKRKAPEVDSLFDELDKLLPQSNIERIMKKILPSNATVHPDALRDAQLCVSELISCLASEGGMIALQRKRKIVCGEDIIQTLENMGYDSISPLIRAYINRYKLARQKVQDAEDSERKGIEVKSNS